PTHPTTTPLPYPTLVRSQALCGMSSTHVTFLQTGHPACARVRVTQDAFGMCSWAVSEAGADDERARRGWAMEPARRSGRLQLRRDRKSTRLNSSHVKISY